MGEYLLCIFGLIILYVAYKVIKVELKCYKKRKAKNKNADCIEFL